MEFERYRMMFHPEEVKVLFIGESPPAGGTFFYNGDSFLAKYTREAFTKVYKSEFVSTVQFLEFFKNIGCYLDDLCLYPVNRMSEELREKERKKGIKGLSRRISNEQPKAIVTIINYVKNHVDEAIELSKINSVKVYNLPFPGKFNNKRYVAELSEVISCLINDCVLPRSFN